ncbi:MAG: hypothetical protein R3318_05250, partial [Gammaproteobacteria bacterium]|nr:hypothetical protein [Gammaproteobacteria bacterium]
HHYQHVPSTWHGDNCREQYLHDDRAGKYTAVRHALYSGDTMTKKHTSANSAQNAEKAFWDHLFSIASTLEDTTSPTNTHMAGIQEHMESVEQLQSKFRSLHRYQ